MTTLQDRGSPWHGFSPREQDIIEGLLHALSVKDIALQLNLTVNTVKDYIKTIYQKAQVHSARALLVKFYEAPVEARPVNAPAALLHTMESLMQGGARGELLEMLLHAARACSGARHAALYAVAPVPNLGRNPAVGRAPGAPAGWLHAYHGRASYPLPAAWSMALTRRDCFHLPAPGRELPGLVAEIIGVSLATAGEPVLLVLSDPATGKFETATLPTVRMLTRLVQMQLRPVAHRAGS